MDSLERGELFDTIKATVSLLHDDEWRGKLFRKSGSTGEGEICSALKSELDELALEVGLDDLVLILKHFPERHDWEESKLSVLLWEAKRKNRQG